jgi:hypothetical protein
VTDEAVAGEADEFLDLMRVRIGRSRISGRFLLTY